MQTQRDSIKNSLCEMFFGGVCLMAQGGPMSFALGVKFALGRTSLRLGFTGGVEECPFITGVVSLGRNSGSHVWE